MVVHILLYVITIYVYLYTKATWAMGGTRANRATWATGTTRATGATRATWATRAIRATRALRDHQGYQGHQGHRGQRVSYLMSLNPLLCIDMAHRSFLLYDDLI